MRSTLNFFKLLVITINVFNINAQEHPCKRKCDENTEPKTCNYYLEADYYFANQPDCRNCSNGVEADCLSKYCIPTDGRSRMVKAFNYIIPGPMIEVCEGDFIVVEVFNRLATETLSVHWHGMHQDGSPEMDGVPMITQRPINPNEIYTYRFYAFQVGTHFYHSHSGSQRADGLFGKLIVRDYDDPKPVAYDEDIHSISLLEWFPVMTDEVIMRYQRTAEFYDINPPKTLLVDSRGHTRTNNIPPTKYNVKQGVSYRFRVIHAGNVVCPIEMSIDNHKLQAFNSDGNDFFPVEVDSITLTNGERCDFVLIANQVVSQYTIRFNTSFICNTFGYAILNYEGANNIAIDYDRRPVLNSRLNCVVDRSSGCIKYSDLQYFPEIDIFSRNMLEGNPDDIKSIYFDQYQFTHERFRGTVNANELFTPLVNQIGFIPPKNTLLCTNYTDICDEFTAEPFTQCTHVVEIQSEAIIEIIFIDEGRNVELAHPFHLHGYSFWVIAQDKLGDSTTRDEVMSKYYNNEIVRNENPILKDTVAVPDGGYVVIRFFSDNPGYWLLHCHVDFHTEEGMQLVIKASTVPPPPNTCTCII